MSLQSLNEINKIFGITKIQNQVNEVSLKSVLDKSPQQQQQKLTVEASSSDSSFDGLLSEYEASIVAFNEYVKNVKSILFKDADKDIKDNSYFNFDALFLRTLVTYNKMGALYSSVATSYSQKVSYLTKFSRVIPIVKNIMKDLLIQMNDLNRASLDDKAVHYINKLSKIYSYFDLVLMNFNDRNITPITNEMIDNRRNSLKDKFGLQVGQIIREINKLDSLSDERYRRLVEQAEAKKGRELTVDELDLLTKQIRTNLNKNIEMEVDKVEESMKRSGKSSKKQEDKEDEEIEKQVRLQEEMENAVLEADKARLIMENLQRAKLDASENFDKFNWGDKESKSAAKKLKDANDRIDKYKIILQKIEAEETRAKDAIKQMQDTDDEEDEEEEEEEEEEEDEETDTEGSGLTKESFMNFVNRRKIDEFHRNEI